MILEGMSFHTFFFFAIFHAIIKNKTEKAGDSI